MIHIRRVFRYAIPGFIAVITSATVFAQSAKIQSVGLRAIPIPADATSWYFVDFSGIIVHVGLPENDPVRWRAVLIAGDMGQQHSPLLAIARPDTPQKVLALRRSLNAATNQIVHCDEDQCWVRIRGISMRIRGGDIADVERHESFKCLVPRLRSDPTINGGDILAETKIPSTDQRAVLPSPPAVGYFEVDHGTLQAVAFKHNGYFETPYLTCIKTNSPGTCEAELCRQFASKVRWSGKMIGAVKLQIASHWTAWEWQDILTGHDTELTLSVENRSSDGHASPRHFALNEKVLTNKNLTAIDVGCVITDETKKCPGATSNSGTVVVPGCADNQWP